ncbi:MAG: sulfurtransferase-like selenium metabolism protein YedF [Synergistaceae bacterium]|nr:sulfurtransferase-like selenium metabolism protein YedF [Synergistaceae bacterium]
MISIDARGRNCPQPVMMTRASVDAGEKEIEVLLDNPVAASNVQRFLEKNGYHIRMMDEEGIITVRGIKKQGKEREQKEEVKPTPLQEDAPSAHRPPGGTALMLGSATIGGEDALLGEILAKSFLGTLAELTDPPGVLALMNEGVKLALNNTSSCEHLLTLEKKGVRILVCGTCTNHFGITADIGVGVISNMFEITEALLSADKTIAL